MKNLITIGLACAMLMFAGNVLADGTGTGIATADQGQAQSIGDIGSNNTTNVMPMASGISYGVVPQMFARPSVDKGANFMSSANLIAMMGAWNVNELRDLDYDDCDVDIDITRTGFVDASTAGELETVTFSLMGSAVANAAKEAGKVIAIGNIQTDDDETSSVELFMALTKKAQMLGASNVILMSEGVKVDLNSSGWGIGASYNYASIDSGAGGGDGSVGAGGTGYSQGKASYTKMPYLTFAFVE